MRIKLLHQLTGFALMAMTACQVATAAGYPERTIKIIATQGPGSSTDLHARLVANGLAKRLGQNVIVENVAGAAGTLGMAAGARAPGDGYTLVIGNNGNVAIAPFTFKSLPYDPNKDLTPVAHLTNNWQVLVASPKLGVSNFAEFIAYAKRNPSKVNYGSPGPGSHAHLAMELLQSMAGIEMTHIPYKTTGQITTDLIAGTLDAAFDNYVAVGAHVEQGRIRLLGMSSAAPLASSPKVPAIAQTVPGYEATGWFGIFAPAGTPADIVQKLNTEINAVLRDPEVAAVMGKAGFEVLPSTPTQFAEFVRGAQKKWGETVKQIGLTPQ